MLIATFKSNQKIVNLLTILSIIILWLPAFFIEPEHHINGVSTNYKWLDVIISILLISIQSVYLNSIVNEYKLIQNNSHLASLMLLVFNSCGLIFLNLNQLIISNTFLLVALHQMLRMYNANRIYGLVFNASLLVALASLIYFPYALFLILIWIVLMYTTTPKWRDFVISLLGFSVPLIYFISYQFVFENIYELKLTDYLYGIFEVQLDELSFIQQYLCVLIVVIVGMSLIGLFSTLSKSVVRVRKMLVVVLMMLVVGLGAFFLNGHEFLTTFIMLSIPLAIITANFFQGIKKAWISELLFFFLVGGIILSYFL